MSSAGLNEKSSQIEPCLASSEGSKVNCNGSLEKCPTNHKDGCRFQDIFREETANHTQTQYEFNPNSNEVMHLPLTQNCHSNLCSNGYYMSCVLGQQDGCHSDALLQQGFLNIPHDRFPGLNVVLNPLSNNLLGVHPRFTKSQPSDFPMNQSCYKYMNVKVEKKNDELDDSEEKSFLSPNLPNGCSTLNTPTEYPLDSSEGQYEIESNNNEHNDTIENNDEHNISVFSNNVLISPNIGSNIFKFSHERDSPTLPFDLDPCKKEHNNTFWSQSPTFPSLSPSATLWSPAEHVPKVSSQLTQYRSVSGKDDEKVNSNLYEDSRNEECGSHDDPENQVSDCVSSDSINKDLSGCDTPTLQFIQKRIQVDECKGVYAFSAINSLRSRLDSQQTSYISNIGAESTFDLQAENAHVIPQISEESYNKNSMESSQKSQPCNDTKMMGLVKEDVTFQIKPARKGNEYFVTNTPKDLYSQPYKYDIRITFPSEFSQSYEPSLQLYVEKTKQFVCRNHKNEDTLIMEKVTQKDVNDRTICNYRVVFNVCSFHVSKSYFTLHIFFLPLGKEFSEKSDFSKFDSAWKSLPFELFARKVIPSEWPSEKEIAARVKSIHKGTKIQSHKTYSNQSLIPLKTTADPALLTHAVNNAIQHRSNFKNLGFTNHKSIIGGTLPIKENRKQGTNSMLHGRQESPRRNKRKRNLQVDTQCSKRLKTKHSGDRQDSCKV